MDTLDTLGMTTVISTFSELRKGPETVAWDIPSFSTKMMVGGKEDAARILEANIDLLDAEIGFLGNEVAYVYHIGGGKHRIVATVTVDFKTRTVTPEWYDAVEAHKAEMEWMFG